jgi:hypothetical protein
MPMTSPNDVIPQLASIWARYYRQSHPSLSEVDLLRSLVTFCQNSSETEHDHYHKKNGNQAGNYRSDSS